jgi:hypothetical protein
LGLFSLRKIYRTCPRCCGPCTPHRLMGLWTSLNVGRWLPDRRLRLNQVNRWLPDPTAGSGRGRRGLALAAARSGRVQRLTGVQVFSSYGGQFSMRFAPTGSQRRGKRLYANLNRRRAATKPDNGEAARPVLGDGEGSLR